jgi:hypothetical protein
MVASGFEGGRRGWVHQSSAHPDGSRSEPPLRQVPVRVAATLFSGKPAPVPLRLRIPADDNESTEEAVSGFVRERNAGSPGATQLLQTR